MNQATETAALDEQPIVKVKRTRREQGDIREDAALYGAYIAMSSIGHANEPAEIAALRVRIINRVKGKLYQKQLELYSRNGAIPVSVNYDPQ